MKIVLRLLLAVFGVAILGVALVCFAGPTVSVAGAFNAYRQAYLNADKNGILASMTPDEITFTDAQRKLALHASRSEVEALPFRKRALVLSMRKQVLSGELKQFDLERASAEELYVALLNVEQNAKVLKPMVVLFAVPTSSSTARGYVKVREGIDIGLFDYGLAISANLYYGFVRSDDGTWRVDPSPILESSAKENESLAKQIEPTGNTYIVKSVLQVQDATLTENLFEPLLKN